jgi:hypothetical protein
MYVKNKMSIVQVPNMGGGEYEVYSFQDMN